MRKILIATLALMVLSLMCMGVFAGSKTVQIPIDANETEGSSTYTLEAVDDSPMPSDERTFSMTFGKGNTHFPAITYDVVGEYHYTVTRETAGRTNGTGYNVTVVVPNDKEAYLIIESNGEKYTSCIFKDEKTPGYIGKTKDDTRIFGTIPRTGESYLVMIVLAAALSSMMTLAFTRRRKNKEE